MKLTFVDSGLLIAAARGTDEVAERALAVLGDPDRRFVCSDYVRLEVLPKPVYNGYEAEAEFYQAFFEETAGWVSACLPVRAKRRRRPARGSRGT